MCLAGRRISSWPESGQTSEITQIALSISLDGLASYLRVMKQRRDPSASVVRVSYAKAALVSLVSVICSWVLTAASFLVDPIVASGPAPAEMQKEFMVWAGILATVIPILVSFPVAIILQRGRIKLTQAMQQLEQAHQALAHQARTDALTGLLNRNAFVEAVEAARHQQPAGALLMVDIDRFKTINDSFGHQAGDHALKLVAEAISLSVRPTDVAGRLGGEEFGVYLCCEDVERAELIAERIRIAISETRFEPEPGRLHAISASVGLAMSGAGPFQYERLLRAADRALYEAKNSGRNRVRRAAPASEGMQVA